MPKKILFESAVHQFLRAAQRLQLQWQETSPQRATTLARWIAALAIDNAGDGRMRIVWSHPSTGEHFLSWKAAKLYTRGDSAAHATRQAEAGLLAMPDRVMADNRIFFDQAVREVVAQAGLASPEELAARPGTDPDGERKHAEEVFHDAWAASVDVSKINVRRMNEVCTAPEMRHIRAALGDLRGRTLLDIGCGLGEASVYFALEGASVTATDISPGMCDTASRLAEANGTTIRTHVSAAEDLGLPADERFDIIYTGNTLHHVDISTALPRLLRHLKPDGVFVSWDPVAYNPIINIYRILATEVRTEDEHPLRLCDVRNVSRHFAKTEVRWFWFTTLVIFMLMAAVQFRSPNKERFWKKVVEESDSWAWLYRPLAALDRALLGILPFLRPLCWNVVIVGKGLQEKR